MMNPDTWRYSVVDCRIATRVNYFEDSLHVSCCLRWIVTYVTYTVKFSHVTVYGKLKCKSKTSDSRRGSEYVE